MENFVDAVRRSIAEHNWHAAVALALALPDICGKLEHPNKVSQLRFTDWFEKYLGSHYRVTAGGQEWVFLSGSDCYALRCAFLHEGDLDITDQRARNAVEQFFLVAPENGSRVHRNRVGNNLQLQVDCFCEEICQGVESWLKDVAANEAVQSRIAGLARIRSAQDIPSLIQRLK